MQVLGPEARLETCLKSPVSLCFPTPLRQMKNESKFLEGSDQVFSCYVSLPLVLCKGIHTVDMVDVDYDMQTARWCSLNFRKEFGSFCHFYGGNFKAFLLFINKLLSHSENSHWIPTMFLTLCQVLNYSIVKAHFIFF